MVVLAVVGGLTGLATAATPATQPTVARVDALLSQLSPDEKISLLAGVDNFYARGVDRLGIPRVKMTDGPNGTRVFGKSTAYPAGVMLAATWDPTLAIREGEQLGRDARARGCHVLLGPGMNLYRNPLNGRNFEYFGEDPLLTGEIAAGYVKGVESQGVAATIKHFAANNQETDRGDGSSDVDEQTLRELYLPAFKRAIDQAHPGAIMAAYNRINGVHCTENEWLLTKVLRNEWHYDGLVMSDWGAVHSTLGPLKAGLDLEMPGPEFLNKEAIEPLLASGQVTQTMIDEKVRHLLTLIVSHGWMDRPQLDESIPKDNPDGATVALDVARAGLTLLKNDGILLPIDRAKAKRIVVVGAQAIDTPIGGGGSGFTEPFHSVSIVDGIRAAAAKDASVTVIAGDYGLQQAAMVARPAIDGGTYAAEYFSNEMLAGEPTLKRDERAIDFDDAKRPVAGVSMKKCSARYRATITPTKATTYYCFTKSDDGSRVFVDGKVVLDDWSDHGERVKSTTLTLPPGRHELVVEYYDHGGAAILQFGIGRPVPLFDDAETAALKNADVVVAAVGFGPGLESEGSDRTYALPTGQPEMLRRVAELNAKLAVIVLAGGSCETSGWIERTPALLDAFYPGQSGGTAVAEVLFGDVAPSGNLPFTWEKRLDDVPSQGHWGMSGHVPYSEGVFIGYRGFEAKRIKPLFPFGFGLSYTTFTLRDAAVTRQGDVLTVTATVTNAGTREGATVVQCYVAPPGGDPTRPLQELKAFAKVELAPGSTREVTLTVPVADLSLWDSTTTSERPPRGEFRFLLGLSAREERASTAISLE